MTETFVRVNYSEVDQMGVAYHARYLVWLDVARCEHLRGAGMSYAELALAAGRTPVATAEASLFALGTDFSLSRLPADVMALLPVEPDPVRL